MSSFLFLKGGIMKETVKHIHLIGIGGASMHSIAAMLKHDGYFVTGSDMLESDSTLYLRSLGISVVIGHDKDVLKDADLVIYTAAIKETDEELSFARQENILCMERAQFLGEYTKDYENLICISGTHGKSTTTSMMASIFLESGLDPTIQVGAKLPKIGGNYKIGGKKFFILEACEYVDSFLHFHPTSEIILNIDNDHLDYFKDLEHIKNSFYKYVELLPQDGFLVVNVDDENTQELVDLHPNVTTYGIQNPHAFVSAKNITYNNLGFPIFDVYIKDVYYETFSLSVFGTHNILNALSCIAMARNYQIPSQVIQKALKEFTGVGRRFEYKGEYMGAHLFDDFAHHPTEIKSTVESVKMVKHRKCYAVFQSHTYSRTKDHLKEFAHILSSFDSIIICDIYAAREVNNYQVKESDLVNLIKPVNKEVLHISSYEEIAHYLKQRIQKDDLIVTIGAGPIYKVLDILKEEN